LLKDSVPCPIPNSEKTRAPRCFFTADITHHAPPFNHDVARFASVPPLWAIHVAQMTRFGVVSKAFVNHDRPEGGCDKGQSHFGQRIVLQNESPQIAIDRDGAA
jgi:hypothetical protein